MSDFKRVTVTHSSYNGGLPYDLDMDPGYYASWTGDIATSLGYTEISVVDISETGPTSHNWGATGGGGGLNPTQEAQLAAAPVTWVSGTTYPFGTQVFHEGSVWTVTEVAGTTEEPTGTPTDWSKGGLGLTAAQAATLAASPQSWTAGTYNTGDQVFFGGKTYVVIATPDTIQSPGNSDWAEVGTGGGGASIQGTYDSIALATAGGAVTDDLIALSATNIYSILEGTVIKMP